MIQYFQSLGQAALVFYCQAFLLLRVAQGQPCFLVQGQRVQGAGLRRQCQAVLQESEIRVGLDPRLVLKGRSKSDSPHRKVTNTTSLPMSKPTSTL